MLEKTLESPLDCRRSNLLILKEISPEYFIGRLLADVECAVEIVLALGSLLCHQVAV